LLIYNIFLYTHSHQHKSVFKAIILIFIILSFKSLATGRFVRWER